MRKTQRSSRRSTRSSRNRRSTRRNTRNAKRGGLFGMSSAAQKMANIRKLAYEDRLPSAILRLQKLCDYIEDTSPLPGDVRMHCKNPVKYYDMLKEKYPGDALSLKEFVLASL